MFKVYLTKLTKFVKEYGIKRTMQVLYENKLQVLIRYILYHILSKKLLDVIVIESHNDFDSNGGALYKYLIENEYNRKYKIVLLLHNRLNRKLPNNVEGFPLMEPSIRKAYYTCKAKYLFADDVITPRINDDQISIYMTHGPISFKNTHGIIVIPSNTNYCLSPSAYYDEYLKKAITITNKNIKMLHLGFPCLDELFDGNTGDLHKMTTKSYSKTVIWMPTFRVGGGWNRSDVDYEVVLGIPLITSIEQYNKLNDYLLERNMLLIIKIHPKQDLSTLKITSLSNIMVLTSGDMKSKEISNCGLYKDMDAMISDYSSSSFDFLNLNRPICYDFSDFEHYKLGMLMDNPDDFMPGTKIYDFDGLIEFLNDVSNGNDRYQNAREELIDKLFEHHDGNSCKRIVEFLGV